MFPSSSRVKLNRVVLTEVTGIRRGLRPRRRGVPPETTESREEDKRGVSEVTPVKDAGSNGRVHSLATDQHGQLDPGNVTQAAGNIRAGRPEDRGVECDRNKYPSPTGLIGSEGCLKRAASTSCCAHCWGCKYISPRKKTLSKKVHKSRDPEQSNVELKINKGHPVTLGSKKTVIWMDQYPKVTLCDIAQKCDVCSHDCGYVLPDALKTKVVHCFKQEMRAGHRFVPGCLGPNGPKIVECARAKKGKSAQSKQSNCHLIKGWTSEASAISYAASSFCVDTNKGLCRTEMQNRVAEEDPGPHRDLTGAEIHRDKRIKYGYSITDGSLSSTRDSDSIIYTDTAKTNLIDKEKTWSGMSGHSQPCPDLSHWNCNNRSTKKKNCFQREPRKGDGAQMSSETICQRNNVDTDDLESFTCQRVRVYCRKTVWSCARAYMSWPFSNTSRTPTAGAGATACQAEPVHPSAGNNSNSPSINQNQSGSLSSRTNQILRKAPEDSSFDTTHQVSHPNKEKQNEDGECTGSQGNGKRHSNMSSQSPDSKNSDSIPQLLAAAKPPASLHSPTATISNISQCGTEPDTDTPSALSTPFYGPESDRSLSTPSPSVLGLSEGETATIGTTFSSLFTHGGSSSLSATPPSVPSSLFQLEEVRGVELSDAPSASTSPESSHKRIDKPAEKPPFSCEETQMTLCCSSPPPSSVHPHNCDSCCSCESFLLLPQDEQGNDNNRSTCRSMPKLDPYYNTKPMNQSHHDDGKGSSSSSNNTEEFLLPPLLSPVSSPQRHLHKTDSDDLAPQIKAKLISGVLTQRCSSPSSDEDSSSSNRDEILSPSETVGSESDKIKTEAAGDAEPGILDEFTAYEQDILLVDVIQDDPELFERVPPESLLKLGPRRVIEGPKTTVTKSANILLPKTDTASIQFEQRLTPVIVDFHCDSPDDCMTEEDKCRPWRPQCSSNSCTTENLTEPATDGQNRNMGLSDANNNHVNVGLKRSQPIQTVNSPHYVAPLMAVRNGSWITNQANMMDNRCQKSNAYCRQYFSESLSCGFKVCRFQHVPVEGDEKYCIETVTRFIKNPLCLQRAGDVFTGYYQNNPPGEYFSMPVFHTLLWTLLKASMVSNVLSVLNVCLAHKIAPGHEFLLALFNFVREKSLMGHAPELMQLTFKMASEGLVLSLDWLECIKNTPEFQQTVHPTAIHLSANHKLSSAPFPEYLNLAHTIVEIELCSKQEDWRQMGKIFSSMCTSSHHPNQVEQISGRIVIALLSESKDKLSLPFAIFAETVCQSESEDALIQSFFGRIGVSLMLRYHKTHQWIKGRRVVEVLSTYKVNYSTLKGLFGNEDGASRCYLITVATELFLLSGSVEGALHTLRENGWFMRSHQWPCEPADLECRSRVLMRLAEKTSQRDTLEVLSNLPGIKEPNDLVAISRYSPLFNSHLQVCMDRQILSVASDTVDFMLSNNLAVDNTTLQMLLNKLGKQNLWLRAREVFRHSLSVGYYPGVSAPSGFMALFVPCHLGEVELALTFEMFIAVNATVILHLSESSTSCLIITLKRAQSSESNYLSAGSRLLSAACIPQPKLTIQYTTVNLSQEQVFSLDISSARRWLRHNHLWANEVWTH